MSRWLLGLSTSEEEHNQSKKLKFLDTRYVDKKFLNAIIFFSFSFLINLIVMFVFMFLSSLPESFLREDDVSFFSFFLCIYLIELLAS